MNGDYIDPLFLQAWRETQGQPEDAVPHQQETVMDTKELVERLRESALGHGKSEGDLRERAADTIERLERERDEARGLIRWAHDTLYEINPSNYDHNEVCRLNDASVEVILGLAPSLGEMHGKTREWWMARARNEADLAISAVGGAAEAEAATLRARVERLEKALRWELNILEVEVRPVVKPSKKERDNG